MASRAPSRSQSHRAGTYLARSSLKGVPWGQLRRPTAEEPFADSPGRASGVVSTASAERLDGCNDRRVYAHKGSRVFLPSSSPVRGFDTATRTTRLLTVRAAMAFRRERLARVGVWGTFRLAPHPRDLCSGFAASLRNNARPILVWAQAPSRPTLERLCEFELRSPAQMVEMTSPSARRLAEQPFS